MEIALPQYTALLKPNLSSIDMVGKSLSHYKIVSELGRGGMGIVYKAQDTKLDRTVAIKILPSAALSSDEDRARFYREAKAAAQLHHPHIASIFEIDEAVPEGSKDDDLRPFIAMEYIDGETLEERIKNGPLKLEEALRIAAEIAGGLKMAHEIQIVHRDIKSANIMVTGGGQAKILDFGLAQTAATTKLTRLGSTLGTVAYMSPEQARGEEVDGRTDLWSLGVILFEMVTGRSPFPGDYEQALIYSILNQDPEPITGLRTGVSMELEMLVSKCLEKEAKHRYQSAADLIADLDRIDSKASRGQTLVRLGREASGQALRNKSTSKRFITVSVPILAAVAIGLVLLFISLMMVLAPKNRAESSGALAATIELVDEANNPLQIAGLFHRHLAISPDGSIIAFSAFADGVPQLFVRDIGSFTATSIPGTEGALSPAFSEDGAWLAYCDDRSLNKVQLDGGLPTVLEESGGRFNACRGVSWIGNEAIVYSPSVASGLVQISSDGSGSRAITILDQSNGEVSHRWPHVLPDKSGIIFTTKKDDILDFGDATVSLYDFSTQTVSTLFEGGTDALVLADGTLLYGRDYTLRIATFDFGSKTVVGGSHRTLFNDLIVEPSAGAADFAVSRNGTLVFIPGNELPLPELTLRDNKSIKFTFDRPDYRLNVPTLSLDNTKAVLTMAAANDFLVLATMGRSEYQILSNTANIIYPSWGPDISSITYISYDSGTGSIYTRDIHDDSVEMLYENAALFEVGNWDPDGSNLVFVLTDSERNRGIWRLTHGEETSVSRIIDTPADEYRPTISPDGTLIAYLFLDDSGVAELYVQDYPALKDRRRVAEVPPLTRPRWDAQNRIYYDTGDNELGRVTVSSGNNIQLSGQEIFLSTVTENGFDVFSDGTSALSFGVIDETGTQKFSILRLIKGWKAYDNSSSARQ